MEEFATRHDIDLDPSYAYSDSLSDLPMLRAVGNPVAVNPDPPLAAIAKEEGWQTLRFERLGRRLTAVAVTILATVAGFGATRVAAHRRPRRRAAAAPTGRMSRRAWGAFAAVSVLWGLPYLFIKIADDGGMPPLDLAWARIALGAVVLIAIAWRAGTLPSLRGRGPGSSSSRWPRSRSRSR